MYIIRSPRPGVRDSCELLCQELNLSSLKEQPVLLIIKPSLPLPLINSLCRKLFKIFSSCFLKCSECSYPQSPTVEYEPSFTLRRLNYKVKLTLVFKTRILKFREKNQQ